MAEEFVMKAVTPEMAQTWLNNNNFDRQRSLREHHIFTLAEEMEGGNFIPHSAIVFARLDKQDFLIDGQHRLNAVMLHGKPVNLPILTKIAANLEQVARWYASIDQGREMIGARRYQSTEFTRRTWCQRATRWPLDSRREADCLWISRGW